MLGGGVNFLLNADLDNASGATEDITGDLRRYDVALLVGAGVALRLPSRGVGPLRLATVFLEARHDHGLLPADEVNDGLKNRTSSLMLGYRSHSPLGGRHHHRRRLPRREPCNIVTRVHRRALARVSSPRGGDAVAYVAYATLRSGR